MQPQPPPMCGDCLHAWPIAGAGPKSLRGWDGLRPLLAVASQFWAPSRTSGACRPTHGLRSRRERVVTGAGQDLACWAQNSEYAVVPVACPAIPPYIQGASYGILCQVYAAVALGGWVDTHVACSCTREVRVSSPSPCCTHTHTTLPALCASALNSSTYFAAIAELTAA
jgi:hypothetical protein